MIPTPSIIDGLQKIFADVWLAGGDEIMVTCPYCHYRGMGKDTSGHLSLNFAKGVGHCVRCDYGIGDLREWLKQRKFTGTLPLRRLGELFKKPEEAKYLLQIATLPPGCHVMGLNEVGTIYADSLIDKRLEPQDWVDARLQKCYQGRYKGYILFPFYEGPNLVYWQARAADPDIPAKLKKQNPPALDLGRASWLYGWGPNIAPECHVYIVEGPLDRISLQKFLKKYRGDGHYAFSAQGTAFSFPDEQLHPLNTQFGKIMSLRPKSITFLFDPDAVKKAEGLAKVFAMCGYEDTKVGRLAEGAGDPNEASDEAVEDALIEKSWEQGINKLLTNATL